MAYDKFLQSVLGDHGYSAIQNAVAQMPELADAVPAQAFLSWADIATRIGYEGVIPGTSHSLSLNKSESHEDKMELAKSLAKLLGFTPKASPSMAINKSQTEQLVKTIDLLIKMNLVKFSVGFKPHGEAAAPAAQMAQSGPKQPTAAQPKQPKVGKIPKMGSGAKAAGTQETNKNRTAVPQAAGTQGPKAAGTKAPQTAGKTPKTGAMKLSEAQKPCPACGQHAFNNARFVGCQCFGDLAKSTYSKAVHDGYVVFFNFQWDADSINKLMSYYKG